MRKFSYFLLFAFIGCENVKKGNDNPPIIDKSLDNEFSSFIDLLPQVPLPYEVNCQECCKHADLNYDNELFEKFQPEGCAIVGVLGKTDKHIMVLVTYSGDMRIPSIKIFDMEGSIVNERNFMTRYCGGDEDFYSSQFLAINKDLTITTRDTVFNITRDSIKYEVIDTTSIEINVQNFQISNDDVIVRIDSIMNTIK
jgi:hypothetical protein